MEDGRYYMEDFFFQRIKENAFTHAVWDSAEAIPTKLKTPLFPRQTMDPERVSFKIQGLVYRRNSPNLGALLCCQLGLSLRGYFKASYLGPPLGTPCNALSPEYGHSGASPLVRCRGS